MYSNLFDWSPRHIALVPFPKNLSRKVNSQTDQKAVYDLGKASIIAEKDLARLSLYFYVMN